MAWIKRVVKDIAFGIHSRIPLCDILFYVTYWSYVINSEEKKYKLMWRYWERLEDAYGPASLCIEYIPCPVCVWLRRRKNPTSIRSCERECYWCSYGTPKPYQEIS